VSKVGGSELAEIVRGDVSDRAAGQASEIGLRAGLRRWAHVSFGHRDWGRGKVDAGVLGVDRHEEFSAAGESGSEAES
jgi:hypothetical protein